MAIDVSGEVVACPKCRNDIPATASFCRRCGRAQGRDALTRAVRKGSRAARRYKRTASLFGIVVAVAWAVMFIIGIASGIRGGRSPSASATPHAAAPNPPAPRTPATVAPGASRAPVTGPRIVEPPTVLRSAVPPPIRAFPVMTPYAVDQLTLRWQATGDRVDCTITNGSAWHVQELWILVNIYKDQRVTDGRSCHVEVSIPPGKTERVELPLDFGYKPGYGLACRVISASGLEPTSPQGRVR